MPDLPPVFGRSPDGRPDWFWIASPYRLMKKANRSELPAGIRIYQRVLWWMIGVGVIVTVTLFVVTAVLIHR